MTLENRQVLLNRKNIKKSLREKEWWFSYLYDESQQLYFGWFFFRTLVTDHFNFICFDTKNNRQWLFEKNIMLDKPDRNDNLDLRYTTKKRKISFTETGPGEKEFNFSDDKYNINLQVETGDVPPFTKFENNFTNKFGLKHTFKNRVKGSLDFEGSKFSVDTDYSYLDHCFGRVPSKAGWHWIAVQNSEISLASLINYGADSQRYTQVFYKNKWTRLDQNVAFEYPPEKGRKWKVTSTDMDLNVEVVALHNKIVKIPPLVPFLLDIKHDEMCVKINGKIRIGNDWITATDMYGVMEQHSGKW